VSIPSNFSEGRFYGDAHGSVAWRGANKFTATSSFLFNMNIERLPVKSLSGQGGYSVCWLLTSLLGELS